MMIYRVQQKKIIKIKVVFKLVKKYRFLIKESKMI
jgi:hypothetical protein